MVATLPDTEINATFLRIEPAGSITSNGQLSVFGTLHNYGSIDVVRMWCFYSGTFRNYSNIVACLLYTSDDADERSSVDLGGRRNIKTKKKE